MTKMPIAAIVVSVALLGAVPAFAQPPMLYEGPMSYAAPIINAAPMVATPSTCSSLGPSVDISGNLGHRGLVVVLTDISPSDESAAAAVIPGIRHWTDANGNFAVRVAVPRAILGQSVIPTQASIRVFEQIGPNNRGPETDLTCEPGASM